MEGEKLKYGNTRMLWQYFEWKRANDPDPDELPWPYYDLDDPHYPGLPLDEAEDVKAWLADMEARIYGMVEKG